MKAKYSPQKVESPRDRKPDTRSSRSSKSSSKCKNETRPRRRASQTHFFKYQLACNPFKAEEDDLKRALIASLQQSDQNPVKKRQHSGNSVQNVKKQPNNQTCPEQSHQASKNANKISNYNNNNNNNSTNNNNIKDEQVEAKPYTPETQDFLTFICFRATPPCLNAPSHDNGNHPDNDNKNQNATNTARSSSNRRPTRQSLRLSSIRKISENDTAVSNGKEEANSFEENIKQADLTLEAMAEDIGNLDEVAQEPNLVLDKQLVKGLMSREFAGAFADEDSMFDSIPNK